MYLCVGLEFQTMRLKISSFLKHFFGLVIGFLFFVEFAYSQASLSDEINLLKNPSALYDNRIDNMAYWQYALRKGYIAPNPQVTNLDAIYRGSFLRSYSIPFQDSPDVMIGEGENTQSENSIAVSPLDNEFLLNSNNSEDYAAEVLLGADFFISEDAGMEWEGEIEGVGGDNSGDPAVAMNADGRLFVGYINEMFGQSVAISDDKGQNWERHLIAPSPGFYPAALDKNHLWIDNSPQSPYRNNVYCAWTRFSNGAAYDGEIQLSYSNNGGTLWTNPFVISEGVNALSHNQGVNIQTGANGELYVVWAIYDQWPGDECAMGFTCSFDGGYSFEPARRIISNIRGIRYSLSHKTMRVNSFPSMTVDLSNGPNKGNLYLVWANKGEPGINTGEEINVYLIKSTDRGNTWSNPVKVNQDQSGLGKQHFFPWITCDPETGNLFVIFYDDRNTNALSCETWVAASRDGGVTWEDFRVSDYSFTPAPIPGLAAGYFGDYLGITSRGMMVYPVWTDNRSGMAKTYISPFISDPPPHQPWVIHNQHSFHDLQSILKDQLTYGDTLWMNVEMKNVGDSAANHVNVLLSTPSSYIDLLDSCEYFGDFMPGQTINHNHAYIIAIKDTVPDDLKIRFDLLASDGDSSWNSHFYAFSSAPNLEISNMQYNDDFYNKNGVPDAGEQATVSLVVANTGDFPLDSVICYFTCNSPFIEILNDSAFIPIIYSGSKDTVHFNVSFHCNLPYRELIELNFHVKSQMRKITKTYHLRSGLIIEDWESGDFKKFPWNNVSMHPWKITNSPIYEGLFCVHSCNIADGETSILSITYNIVMDDTVSFYYKTSTESGYDFLSFFIDNIQKKQWSGVRNWKRASFLVPAGRHTLRWQYSKDLYYGAGEDKVWLDYITLPLYAKPQVHAMSDCHFCYTYDSVPVFASVKNIDSLVWLTLGDGYFYSKHDSATYYYPGQEDRSKGSVNLIITGFNEMEILSDTCVIYFDDDPSIPFALSALPDTFCLGLDSILLSANLNTYDSIFWTDKKCGDTPIGGGLNVRVLAPLSSQKYYAYSSNACGISLCDSVSVVVLPLPEIHLGNDTVICKNASISLDAGDYQSYLWFDGSTKREIVIDSTFLQVDDSLQVWIKITDSNFCDFSDTILVIFKPCPEGMVETPLTQISISPNPSDGYFRIYLSQPVNKECTLEIIDENGRNVYRKIIPIRKSEIFLDLRHQLRAGNYLLRLSCSQQIYFQTKLIII